jgi:hypothetical protein
VLALVDESIRAVGDGGGSLYIVAAAIVLPEEVASCRARISAAFQRPRPFHWRAEERGDRGRMIEAVVEIGLGAVVCDCRAGRLGAQERARARCLHALLWDLRDGVSEVLIDTRGPHADRRDRRTLRQAQRTGAVPRHLRYDFRSPREEPLLWAADAIAGAVGDRLAKGDASYYELLRPVLTHHSLSVMQPGRP